jgi:hypothetical protein
MTQLEPLTCVICCEHIKTENKSNSKTTSGNRKQLRGIKTPLRENLLRVINEISEQSLTHRQYLTIAFTRKSTLDFSFSFAL